MVVVCCPLVSYVVLVVTVWCPLFVVDGVACCCLSYVRKVYVVGVLVFVNEIALFAMLSFVGVGAS